MHFVYALLIHRINSALNKICAICILSVFMAACSVMKPAPTQKINPLPQQNHPGADTVLPNFRYLFADTCLLQLIDAAIKNNTDLAIAGERINIALANLSQQRGALLPTVNGLVNISADRYGKYTMNGVGNFDTNLSPNISKEQTIPVKPTTDFFAGVRSSWEIDLWGKLHHLKKAAQAEWLATQSGRQLIITTLVATLATGYYNLLGLDTELKIVQRNIELQQQALKIIEAQKEGGRANQLAVQQFRAQLLNTQAIEYDILQNRIKSENELNVLAGRYPQFIQRDSALSEPIILNIEAGLPSTILYKRPDIRQAEFDLAAAHENVQAARAAFLPSLTISPYLALNAFTPSLLLKSGSNAYGIAGGITAPLFQQNQIRARFNIANSMNRQATLNYQQKLYNAYGEVLTNLKEVENLRAGYALKSQQVKELQSAVVTARDLYLTGYATYLEVIAAQKNLLEAELQQAEQKKRIYLSLVSLYRSFGGGW